MTLTANFGLSLLVEERGFFSDLDELVAVAGFLHDGVAVDTGNSPTLVGTCFPVGLDASLMAAETRFVLYFR